MENKDYVSYEQARKLKECGFDVPCKAVWHFDGEQGNFIEDYPASFRYHYECPNFNDSRIFGVHIYSAPHVHDALRWLRMKGIYVEPHFLYEGRFEVFIKSEKLNILKNLDDNFEDYDTAMSAGINKALEMLKSQV